jgi:hypothetical protein
MPDILLLEDGTGGYLLEDGSGVLTLESVFRLEVAGVDLLGGLFVTGEPTVTNTAYRQCGTMSFRVEGAPGDLAIVAENPIVFRDSWTGTIYYGGLVKTVTPGECTPGWRVLDIECQDYTVLPGMDVIDSEPVLTGLTDKQIITAAFAAHGTKGVIIGTECQVLATSVTSTATYLGNTLAEFLDALCALTGGSWYVDYSRHLHYFLTESELAPFAVSADSADNVTTFFCDGLSLPEDSIDLKNAVLYIPGEGGDAVPTWYTDPASIAATAAACGDNGRREACERDDRITVQATLDSYGAAFLTANAKKHPGSFTCWQPGLRGGMWINITSADDGLSAAPFAIVSVTTRLIQAGETMADSYVSFDVAIGDRPATLGGTMAKLAQKAVPVQAQIDGSLANQIALDFANGLTKIPIVNSLPTLPDAAFPNGFPIVLTTDRMLYISSGTAWVINVDGSHIIAGSISTAALAATVVVANVANIGGTVTIDSTGETITGGKLSVKNAAGTTTVSGGVVQQVLNTTAEVKIDSTGVAITNGALTVTNGSSVVIIDGQSNMLKVATKSFLSSASGPNATTMTLQTDYPNGLTAAPAHQGYCGFAYGQLPYLLMTAIVGGTPMSVADQIVLHTTIVSTNQTRVQAAWSSGYNRSALAWRVDFFIFKESVI